MENKKQYGGRRLMSVLKRLVGSAVFLGILAFMFIRLGYLITPNINGLQRKEIPSFYAQEENSLDVVTIGSSAMYRFINVPMIYETTGLTNYDLGSAAMPGQAYTSMIREVLKTQDPQLFIMEMRCFLKPRIHEAGTRRMTNNMNSSLNRISLITKLVEDPMEWDDYIFRLTKYHTYAFDFWEDLKSTSDPDAMSKMLSMADNKNEDNNKGWNNILATKSEMETLEFPDDTQPVPLDDASAESLNEILSFCKKENIPALFIITPYFCTPTGAGKSLTIENTIREAGFECLNYLPLMDDMGLDPMQDFYDRSHTNLSGASKVTQVLCDFISEKYDLKTEHSAQTQQEWDAYLNFNKEYVEKKTAERELAEEAITEETTENTEDV